MAWALLRWWPEEDVVEKILVTMNPAHTRLFAGLHALNLARRINARVIFLLVSPAGAGRSGRSPVSRNEAALKKRVEALIDEARSDGVAVDYYAASGDYEGELIRFVQDNKVTLLVVETPVGPPETAETFRNFLNKLRHRIDCRIEVVNEKPKTPDRKE